MRIPPLALLLSLTLASFAHAADAPQPIALKSSITHVQPWTGIVLWDDSPKVDTDAIQLEYRYVPYDAIVKDKGDYDWSPVEKLLAAVAKRKHQAVIRFYFDYPGKPSAVPGYIRALPDYQETTAKSEGKLTGFGDWTHPELKRFTLEFYTRFARKFDRDPRLAYLETGFGLWGEYHIYDGPMKLGKTFPDKAFQTEFIKHLGNTFESTPWLISKDAAEEERTPFATTPDLVGVPFGVFDDSFLHRTHHQYNAECIRFFGTDRWETHPFGGEFSYYTKRDQKMALAKEGPYGISFEKLAAQYHLSFIIGNNQPTHQPLTRIAEAGQAIGYRLQVLKFEGTPTQTRVTITNTGIAPPYHDAYVTVQGARAKQSLRGLLPGEKRTYVIAHQGLATGMSITSDRLVPGQVIEFEADLSK